MLVRDRSRNRLVASLDEMTLSGVPAVGCLRVDAVQLPHPLRQIALEGLCDEMVMIGHEAIGRAAPMKAVGDLFEDVQEDLPITVIVVDRLLPVAARGDVVDGAGKFDSQGSGHAWSSANRTEVTMRDLTPPRDPAA